MPKIKPLVPDFSAIPLINKSKMENIQKKGYFTINNHIYRLDEDKWNIGVSLKELNPNIDSYWFDFSVYEDKIKPLVKLWIYFEINPYKNIGTCKLSTIRGKLNILSNCYLFFKKSNLEKLFISPNYYAIKQYRDHLKVTVSYMYQNYSCKGVYAKFLGFVEELFHIKQDDDAMDLLCGFDIKKQKTEKYASITDAIENEFFKRIYKVSMDALHDDSLRIDLRIVAATLILFSQTGLRKSELLQLNVQPIQKLTIKDDNDKPMEINYIYAYVSKTIRASDVKIIKVKVPLTKEAMEAYMFLVKECKVLREKINVKQLIVFPKQQKRTTRSITWSNYSTYFYLYFYKELDNINVQEKYPELRHRKITLDVPILNKELYNQIVSDFGTNRIILSYPILHQYRKTFATMLYQHGHPVEIISKLLHHYSPKITESYYIRPKFNQRDFATTKKTYDSIIKHNSSVLGKKSADFMKRLKEYMETDEVATICKTDDELVDYMSKNHPLHAKDIGFCLLSDIYPCTVRTDEERMMCAFDTCSNIGFMFYNLVEHYQQMKNYEKSIMLNKQEGLELAAQKEANRLKYLLKTFLIPELNETTKEIAKHGRDQILEWYPEMGGILNELDKIRDEILSHQKEYGVTA